MTFETTKIAADSWNKGEPHWVVSVQAAPSLVAALGWLRGLGGVVASAGGLRSRKAKVKPGRALYSVHYFGEAIDLHTQTREGPCRAKYGGKLGHHTLWLVTPGQQDDDKHDARAEYWTRWRKSKAGVWTRSLFFDEVIVAAESMTRIMADFGWTGIPARFDKAGNCVSPEDWHFQRNGAFIVGETFLDACGRLLGMNEKKTLAWRPKARAAKWNGRSFA